MSFRVGRFSPEVGGGLSFAASYGSSNTRLVVGGEDCSIRIFHPDEAYRRSNLVITSAMTDKKELKMPITALRFRPGDTSNILLAATCDGSLSFWHIGAMKMVHSVHDGTEANGTYAADFSPNGSLLATGGTDGVLRIYDATHGNGQLRLLSQNADGPTAEEPRAHPTRIQTVRFVDENVALSGGWDRVVHVWDVRVGGGAAAGDGSRRPVKSIRGPYMVGDGLDVWGNYVVCASSERYENQLELFDLRRPEDAVHRVTLDTPSAVDGAPPPSLYCAKFNPRNTSQIAVGGTHYYGVFDLTIGGKAPALRELTIEGSTAEGNVAPTAKEGASQPVAADSKKHNTFCAAWSTDGRSCLFAGRGAVVVEA